MREGGGGEEGTVEGGKCERVRRCEECEEGERMRDVRGEGRKGEGKKGKKGRRKGEEERVMWRFVPLDSLPSKAVSHGGRHERTFARGGRKEVRSQHSTVSTWYCLQ